MIDFSVYRKPTHTDCYLQYLSHHPGHVKGGMVSGLFHRARAITQGQNKEKEEGHLTQVLQENRYRCEVVITASQPRAQRHKRSSHSTPSASPMYQALAKISGGSAENTVLELRIFRTQTTLRWELSRIKDRDPALKASGVVYEIFCGCGQSPSSGKQRGHWRRV